MIVCSVNASEPNDARIHLILFEITVNGHNGPLVSVGVERNRWVFSPLADGIGGALR